MRIVHLKINPLIAYQDANNSHACKNSIQFMHETLVHYPSVDYYILISFRNGALDARRPLASVPITVVSINSNRLLCFVLGRYFYPRLANVIKYCRAAHSIVSRSSIILQHVLPSITNHLTLCLNYI